MHIYISVNIYIYTYRRYIYIKEERGGDILESGENTNVNQPVKQLSIEMIYVYTMRNSIVVVEH